ncbi:MAG TPA: hypothetical protein VK942_16595, partial [Actinomycetes bacterium]|nr:hypothetical protein [Actinomycetes bacterium]
WTGKSKARELHIPENLPSSIERLIETKLAPLAQTEETHQLLHPKSVLKPFLTTPLDEYLAGWFLRWGAAKSECWCFAKYAVSIAPEIVKVALQEWQKRSPETFPIADWANNAMWRTPAENRVATELARLDAKRTAVLFQLDEQEQQLENELKQAQHLADIGERLLLTARGDELVHTVDRCLTDCIYSGPS